MAKIRIVKVKSKYLKDGDLVVLYPQLRLDIVIKEVRRGVTFIHKHKYVEINLGVYADMTERFYDYGNEVFEKIEVKY